MAASTTATDQSFRVVGTRPIRHDGIDKVTGRAKYGADYSFPGMLHGKILRSPHARALIKGIDFDKALQLPGVKAVLTGKDLPPISTMRLEGGGEGGALMLHPYYSETILARDRVLYDGHPIAVVAATSVHIAEEALRLIDVDYEVLSPVLSVEEAMKPDAPILLAELRNEEEPDRPTNVAHHVQLKRGDLEAGFKAADYVVEREFKTSMVHQGYIEPHNAIALYNPDGHATLYCSTQGPFWVRTLTAAVLGMDPGSLRVVPAEIGGGFGGKVNTYLEPLAVLLAKRTGRPVKLVMNRAEVLRATGPTSGSKMRIRIGADKIGRITAVDAWMALEAGCFPGSPHGGAAQCALGCYDIPNLQIDAYDVVVNKPRVSAYRAPGAPIAAFGIETVVDELAEKCGIDPLDFRLRNAAKEGTLHPAGIKFKRIGFIETCEAIKNSSHYRSKAGGKYRGRGVAAGFWFNTGMKSSAEVHLHPDGTASLVTGAVDIGGTRAVHAMIVAEVLGLDAEEVRPIVTDTDSAGYVDVTGGSRTGVVTGWAVYEAAREVVHEVRKRAAHLWERRIDEIEFRDGWLRATGNGIPPARIKEIAPKLLEIGGPIAGRGMIHLGGHGAVGPSFAVDCADVEVDPDTGKVQLLRFTVAQDVGRALHPSYAEGQMQGGASQGIGWALNEEYFYDTKGILRNAGLLDYRMPTCLDLPLIETILVEVPHPDHPLGARGAGEVPIVPPMAAIANAIYNAIGVRMTELPMSPPKLLKAIRERGVSEPAAAGG